MTSAIKILAVDDEKSQLVILDSYLKNFNYQVYLASSGKEAIELCRSITPDLILLDLLMPEINGVKTCKQLKSNTSLINTPILILTGKNDSQSIHRSFKAGAVDFLIKPINPTLLKKKIEYALYNSDLFKRLLYKEQELNEAQTLAKIGTIKINTINRSVNISTNCYDLLGLNNENTALSFDEFLSHVHPDDLAHVIFILDNAIDNKEHYILEYRFISNQKEFIIYQHGDFIQDINHDAPFLLGSFQDVTESRKTKESFDYSRFYDPLTDIPNRSFYETQVQHILTHPPQDTLFVIVFIGLDNFSRINDEYGYQGGDSVLKEIADRFIYYESLGHVICRFGGDVFAMLIKNIYHIDECTKIIDELIDNIKKPIILENNAEVFMTASIGASVFPLESEDEQGLIIGAEAAMMLSREEGGNRYTYRTNTMNIEMQKRMFLLKEMRSALKNNEFHVYYQPQIDSKNLSIVGMEALVRWIHPLKGIISPDDFIPLAEESGLIIPIGDFVMKEACRQTRAWLDLGFELEIGINISAQQFETDDFIDKIKQVLKLTELPIHQLEIEITESMAMIDHDNTLKKLSILREFGIKTSMDDFGTGYSSLSQLQSIPLDTLKVDQAFVKRIELDDNPGNTGPYKNSAIANAIITMSHSLGLRVIAEGVETIDQCHFLQDQNSEILQGYLFSKPIPADEFETILKQQSSHNANWLSNIKL